MISQLKRLVINLLVKPVGESGMSGEMELGMSVQAGRFVHLCGCALGIEGPPLRYMVRTMWFPANLSAVHGPVTTGRQPGRQADVEGLTPRA